MSFDTLQQEQARLARLYQETADKMRGRRDGVVVTPVEIVDYQIRAIKNQLATMGKTLADPDVRIIDPFGGTGIYTARLLQTSGLTPLQTTELYHFRLLVLELDETAALMAEVNLRTVHRQLTGVNPVKRVVHRVDTFTLTDEDIDRLFQEGWE